MIAELELLIKNEGKGSQEYIYTWTLQSVNKTTNATNFIDNRQAAKLIEAGKTFSVPLKFESLSPGNYTLGVEVNYGKYTSKALNNFEIKVSESTFPGFEVPWYLIILPVVLLAGLYVVLKTNEQKKKPQRTFILKE